MSGKVHLSRRERRVVLVLLTGAANLSAWTIAATAQVSPPLVMRVIDRLEDAGAITGEWGQLTGADGPRRLYALTGPGRAWAFDALALEPADVAADAPSEESRRA